MMAKNVFAPIITSVFRHKLTMHTSIWEVGQLIARMKTMLLVANRRIKRKNRAVLENCWNNHIQNVLHYEYSEYNKNSRRYGKCLHKWSRFTKCSEQQLSGRYFCGKHLKNHGICKHKGRSGFHPILDYYPPRADSLYADRIRNFAPYLLNPEISTVQ